MPNVVSIAETAQEPESVQHHASLAAVQQDRIHNLQTRYNSLLNRYQKKNAASLMSIKSGKSRRKNYAVLQGINNSLISTGNDLLDELSDMRTDDPSIQQNLDDQRDQMQRHMGYLHELGNARDSRSPTEPYGYYVLSWTIVSVLVGSLIYRSFKGK